MFEMSVKAVCVLWMVLLGVVCCLDHMAWASAAGMQSMVHRSHMPTCTDAVVTPTISCTSPKTSCKAQHTCVANNKATGGSSLSNGDGQDTNAKSTKPHAGKDRRTRSRTGHGARQICKHASQAMCRAGLIRQAHRIITNQEQWWCGGSRPRAASVRTREML